MELVLIIIGLAFGLVAAASIEDWGRNKPVLRVAMAHGTLWSIFFIYECLIIRVPFLWLLGTPAAFLLTALNYTWARNAARRNSSKRWRR